MRRTGDWIQTYTGGIFYPLDPRPDEINIEDIAHSLSLQCRFSGHCREHYSVAQHSVILAENLPEELRLWGLLHDASEAYLVDLPRPIKRSCDMGRMYREYEAALMRCVCERFNLPVEEPAEVKRMDTVLLMTEKRDLMTPEPKPWEDTEAPLSTRIRPISSSSAERLFLSVYRLLIKKGAAA
jgi:uncharacterized protein